MRIASEIRAEMARQQRTQAELAERLGLAQPAVSRRLRGETPFDVNELMAAAAFLGVPAGTLVEPAARYAESRSRP